jgi:hypothetical protein
VDEDDLAEIQDPALRHVLVRMDARLEVLERRSGVLVHERDLPDGTVEVTARKAGVDLKTWITTVGGVVVPIVTAIIISR